MIHVIDLGFGNLDSLCRFIASVGLDYDVIDPATAVSQTSGVFVLPGNGHWDSYLQDQSLNELLSQLPAGAGLIGICGGFQVMFDSSEEGRAAGLGILQGEVRRLNCKTFPHVGPISVSDGGTYYFLNSYGVPAFEAPGRFSTYEVEGQQYLASWNHERYAGFQFHPEVSRQQGRTIFCEAVQHVKDYLHG